MEVGAVILPGRDPLEMMRGMGYGGGRGVHSLTDRDLFKAWFTGAVKRRDSNDLAQLAKRSLQHTIDAEVERFEEHLTTDLRSLVDYVQVFDVAEGKRTLASLAVKVAASDLGIDEPPIKWFRQAEDGQKPVFSSQPLTGLADRSTGVIWLSSKLPALQVAATVAHEMSHMAGRNELAAQLYGAQYDMENG